MSPMLGTVRPAWFTEDLELLADAATRFAERDCLPHDARWREQRRGDRDGSEKLFHMLVPW